LPGGGSERCPAGALPDGHSGQLGLFFAKFSQSGELIGLCLSIVGAVAMWDAGLAWYMLGLAASALPSAWLGGRLGQRRAR
jgi:hypothetical protein